MAIAGALIGSAIGAFGKKPKKQYLTPIDPNAVQKETVAGNAASFSDIAALAANVNTFNQDQLDALIDRVLPGARAQIQETLSSQLKGEIPDDVKSQIYRGVAERSAGGNSFGGGGFTRNVTARDLGLTSLDITNKALSSAESWLSKASSPTFDVTSMFFSPQQRLAFSVQQQGAKYQQDLLNAGIDAAPDPATAALGTEIDRFFNTAASVGMMAAGGAMGGGGGMGGLAGGMGGSGGGGGSIGSAGGQGLPGLGQTSMNGAKSWNNEFGGGLGGSVNGNPYSIGGYGFGR